ncbi:hypothetical protein [Amycolatopsis sp. NPDC059021]|uniref:hypothetical protein n=1 Tax=Amycolatopsis sp. NPDC059021 TaxID=3346704 RepID=UPI00366D1F39
MTALSCRSAGRPRGSEPLKEDSATLVLVKQMDSPPLFCDNTEYAAGLVRRVLGGFIGDTVGVLAPTDFAVSLSTSGVTVAPGRAAIPAAATETGVYLVEASSATMLTLDPADATRDRVDRLVAYAVPPATAADAGKWFFEIRKGEPSATPQPPEVPNAYVVWDFAVPAASKGVNPSGFDRRLTGGQQYISGPVISGATKPAAARVGQLWTDTVAGQVWVSTGAVWQRVTDPTLPRGVVAEVKRTTEDRFEGWTLLERITVPLDASRRYRVSWSTNHYASNPGPPNGNGAIRIAPGNSISTDSPLIRQSGILKNSTTAQAYELSGTFTVTASGTYTLAATATANGAPDITLPGNEGRVFLLEDIGAA